MSHCCVCKGTLPLGTPCPGCGHEAKIAALEAQVQLATVQESLARLEGLQAQAKFRRDESRIAALEAQLAKAQRERDAAR